MKTLASRPRRRQQRGAVTILFGLAIFVLFGFMALAVDLGRTYVVRTELQNAADAAALAGAMQLNQTQKGVWDGANPNSSAVGRAINIAAQNSFKFSAPVVITIENLSVGTCPDDGCMVPANSITSDAMAAGRTFLKVEIPSGGLATFFARVPTTVAGTGTPSTSTYGRAVAGHFVTQIIPMGVCAIDLIQGGRRPVAGGLPDELTELGFRRGVAYNIPQLNPLGGASGDPLWINPLNAPPGACNAANSSANVMKPFVCTGTSTVITSLPGLVYANTGGSYGPMETALNSRFDDYGGGPNACDPASAPPDINMRTYDIANPNAAPPIAPPPPPMKAWSPRQWVQSPLLDPLHTLPNRQSIEINTVTGKPYDSPSPTTPTTIQQYGALWSYSRAVQAVGTSPNATAGPAFELADWQYLYRDLSANFLEADTSASGYPASPSIPPFPVGSLAAPYNTSGGAYFQAPSLAHPGRRNRRVLNVAILDCTGLVAGPGLACATLPVVGVGKFFMQTKADLTGGIKAIQTEFAGLINPLPSPVVRLYR